MANLLRRDTDNASHYISSPDSPALSITGDFDIRYGIMLPDYTPAADTNIYSKSGNGVTNDRFYGDILSTGLVRATWIESDGATVRANLSTVALSTVATDGEPVWVRVTADMDNGAAGLSVRFYYSLQDMCTAISDLTWTQLGATVTTPNTSDIEDNNRAFKLAFNDRFNYGRMVAGGFHYFEMRDGIDGTRVCNPDFRSTDQGNWAAAIGGGTVTDDDGNVWTVNGAGWTYVLDPCPSTAASIRTTRSPRYGLTRLARR